MQRINNSDIVQGKPLSFNCYASSGILLLRRGRIISSEKQIAAPIERGPFMSGGETEAAPAATSRHKEN